MTNRSPFAYHAFFQSFFLFIALTYCCKAQVQLCNGSLGDPVVNITFSIETENRQILQTYNSGEIPVEQTIQLK